MAKVIIIGPAHPLRGGLATFDHRLAKAFMDAGFDTAIWSFSLQYPSFLFPGKSQFTDEPAPENITIHTRINSINPLNWAKVGREIGKENADLIIVRYWLPFMGPALGTILRKIRRNRKSKIICIADNIIPHEKRPGDIPFTKYFVKTCHAFITMSEKVLQDLRTFTQKPAQLVPHPLYDNFGSPVSMAEARQQLGLDVNGELLLFFGFIRKYKGLDLLLDAMRLVRNEYRNNDQPCPKLLIAGEFYEDDAPYKDFISANNLEDTVILRTQFIPDSEVRYYLCATNLLVQPYRNATQSGVTPLAYYFEKPMVVTNVGGLPALVTNGKSGLVPEPDAASIATAIIEFFKLGEAHFIPHLRAEKEKYSWTNFVDAIKELAEIK